MAHVFSAVSTMSTSSRYKSRPSRPRSRRDAQNRRRMTTTVRDRQRFEYQRVCVFFPITSIQACCVRLSSFLTYFLAFQVIRPGASHAAHNAVCFPLRHTLARILPFYRILSFSSSSDVVELSSTPDSYGHPTPRRTCSGSDTYTQWIEHCIVLRHCISSVTYHRQRVSLAAPFVFI